MIVDVDLTAWCTEDPEIEVTLEEVGHFNARGMRLVYGRCDRFDRHHTFNMDLWVTREGGLFMRCWSRCAEIYWRSFRINGVDLARVPDGRMSDFFQDEWIPVAVRRTYDQWITDEW
jgi:hypothetical protein